MGSKVITFSLCQLVLFLHSNSRARIKSKFKPKKPTVALRFDFTKDERTVGGNFSRFNLERKKSGKRDNQF